GPIRYAEVRYASPSRGDRSRPWNWWSDADEGGGVWGAVGSHFVDALRYLGCEIEAVQAVLATIIDERSGKRVTSDDFASVNLRLTESGRPARSGGASRTHASLGRRARRSATAGEKPALIL